MTRRPRLLFLCHTLPYPPDGGVQIRTYNVLRLLARAFDITALCFYRWKGGLVQRDVAGSVAALREFAQVEAFAIPQEHSRIRLVWDHVRSLLQRRVYTLYAYQSQEFRTRLADVIGSSHFDLVHVDCIDLAGYLPLLPNIPVVCVHHNVESELLRRRAKAERTAWRRFYVGYQARLTERQLRAWCERVALNVTVSQEDLEGLRELAPGAKLAVVPNGVDTDTFRPAPGRDDGLVFVGGNSWFPNKDALRYFCDKILPLIRSTTEAVPTRWVGRASPEERQRYRRLYGVELTGYVKDIRPYVHNAACYVVPLRVGGGTRLKILDAWAMGKAVVSTSIGCEGLVAEDGKNILIRDTPEEFAEAVRTVLRDTRLRRSLGENARKTVESTYSWDIIGAPMIERYLKLTRKKRQAQNGAASLPGPTALAGW